MENPNDEQSSEISQYNEASLQIMRLHELWLKAENYASKGILIKWKFILDAIYRELYADIKRKEDCEEVKVKDFTLRKKIAISKTKSDLYVSLNNRHTFLKELQDVVGKGGRYADIDTEGFD